MKDARKLGADQFWRAPGSILPYDLAFDLVRTLAHPLGGVLEARLTGDLEGVIRWSIEPAGDGCRITFDEEVVTTKAALNRLAPIVRSAYVANHALMMARGEAGPRTFLARYALARRNATRG